MNVKLAKFSFSGIKNIEETITFDFIPKKSKNMKLEDFEDFAIKGLYGPNGTGKTALVEAMTFYKKITTDVGYLTKSYESIAQIINRNTQVISIEVELFVNNPKLAKKTYSVTHSLDIAIRNNKLYIEKEFYIIDEQPMLCIEKGEIKYHSIPDDIVNKMINTLNSTSAIAKSEEIISLFLESKESLSNMLTGSQKNSKHFIILRSIYTFSLQLNVFFEEKDVHDDYLLKNYFNTFDDSSSIDHSDLSSFMGNNTKQKSYPPITTRFNTNVESLKHLNSELPNLTKFIQIFKPNLTRLYTKSRPNNDMLEVEVIAEYNTAEISLEFESVGIKKLVGLYYMIQHLKDGGIVVFDELDAHLHDVALTEILCYLEEFGNGQLIFTCHNLMMMDVLEDVPNSIDILTLDGEVKTWKRKGNAVAKNSYKNGYYTNDFNYGYFDLVEVFDA